MQIDENADNNKIFDKNILYKIEYEMKTLKIRKDDQFIPLE